MLLPAPGRATRSRLPLFPLALGIGLGIALFAASASGRSGSPALDDAATTQAAAAASTSGDTARLLVKFAPGATADARSNALDAVGGKAIGSVRDLGVQVVTVPGSAPTALSRIRGRSDVAYAEVDKLVEPQDVLPDDPSFPTNYAVGGGAWGWTMTHTTQAWDITKGDPSVVVAVLDTGIKTSGLNDFDGQISSTYNAMTGSTDVTSNAGVHGTYVAGIIGLALGNGKGNAGYCPGCRLMIVQVGTDSGAYWSDLANGLTYAADHGARVANMSWAGSTDSPTLAAAATYAHNHGVVMTAAAGNANCSCVTYPSADPYVLGVAGVGNAGAKAGDSNYGSSVDVAAPEGNMTAWPSMNGAPGYAAIGGTSSAAPVVAGIAGLLFSANPSLSATQVEQALESTAVPVGFQVAYGRVDTLAALNALGFSDPQPSSGPVNVSAPRMLVETNGDYDAQPLSSTPQVGQVLLRGQGGWTGSAPLSLSAVEWQRCDVKSLACTTVTTAARYTVQTADTGFGLRFVATVKNGIGSASAASPLSAPVGGAAVVTAPLLSAAPTISGTPQDGQTVSATTGTWTGSPTGYSQQWQRCDSSGGSCVALAGATGTSYAVQTADVGSTLRVSVTAANSGGTSTAQSSPTAVVAAAPVATPPPPPPSATTQSVTFSGSLSSKNPSKAFNLTVGAGVAKAQLTFSKCNSLSLDVSGGGGSKSGPSVVALSSTLPAGTYAYTVSGGRCSFTLNVTTPAP